MELCCLCQSADVVTGGNPVYTDCCCALVCSACRDDLRLGYDTTPPTCLTCSQAISYHSLVDPVKLVRTNYCNLVDKTIITLTKPITAYTMAITKLQQDLTSHYANIAGLRELIKEPELREELQREIHRVIKPLSTTIHDNTTVLTTLQQLHRQLTGLVDQPDNMVNQGRLQHLASRIDYLNCRSTWSPGKLVIPLLWYCRHPLGSRLVSTDLCHDRTSTEHYLDFSALARKIQTLYATKQPNAIYADRIIDRANIRYHEISPDQFVIIVTIKSGWVFLCRLQALPDKGRILFYATNCQADSLHMSGRYLVYQNSAGVIVYYDVLAEFLDQNSPVEDSLSPARYIPVDLATKILTLEQTQLWCYHAINQELSCYDLTTDPVVITKSYSISAGEVISYHKGIYVTKSPTAQYQVRALHYPNQSGLNLIYQPKVYCDGTVCYSIDKVVWLCHREDLSGAEMVCDRDNVNVTVKDQTHCEMASTGQLITWGNTYGGDLLIKRYG